MGTVIALPFPSCFRRFLPLRQVLRVGLLILLWAVLGGCGWVNPAPPRSVVVEAVAQKVAQTQAALQQQLGLGAEAEDITLPQPSGVHITGHHWNTLNRQPVVEVKGTYHLKGGGLGWGQQRQTRPFSLYLRRAGEDQWVVLDPVNDPAGDSASNPQ